MNHDHTIKFIASKTGERNKKQAIKKYTKVSSNGSNTLPSTSKKWNYIEKKENPTKKKEKKKSLP